LEDYRHDGETELIIAAALEVHRHLGPGLLESAYREALARELEIEGLPFAREVRLRASYKGRELRTDYRLDFLVFGSVVVEVKALEVLAPVHGSQLLTYMRLSGKRRGLLINFNVPLLKKGIRRLVNEWDPDGTQ
jgi:GxxExxY protein